MFCFEKIIFEAVRGSDFRGDIALDDIYFKEAPCGKAAPAPTPTPTSSPVTCSFDTDDCGWETNKWLRHAGATPTANTGPTADHTTGNVSLDVTAFLFFKPPSGLILDIVFFVTGTILWRDVRSMGLNKFPDL